MKEEFVPQLRFLVTSDIHVGRESLKVAERFRNGMRFAYAYAAKQCYAAVDAFFSVGDFANSGAEEEMLLFRDLLDECLLPQTERTLMLASHEFKRDGQEMAYSRLESIFHMQPDTHKCINGFHCIAISTENGCHIGEAKQAWLSCELQKAAAEAPKKTIFVFQHPHITDTVYGSVNWGEDDITAILMDFPQVIDFSGHSHAPVNDPRSIHQRHFTCHGTGSFSYFELDEFDKLYGTVPPDAGECAQFLIVEAAASGAVRILPVDALTRQLFPCVREIKTPWEPESFQYTDKRFLTTVLPYFPKNATASVVQNADTVSVSFSQAVIDEDMVDSYFIRIRRKKDGIVFRQAAIWSSYYLYTMPDTCSVSLQSLPQGTYTAEIWAEGFWHNRSREPLCVDFTVNSR